MKIRMKINHATTRLLSISSLLSPSLVRYYYHRRHFLGKHLVAYTREILLESMGTLLIGTIQSKQDAR